MRGLNVLLLRVRRLGRNAGILVNVSLALALEFVFVAQRTERLLDHAFMVVAEHFVVVVDCHSHLLYGYCLISDLLKHFLLLKL